MRHINITVDPVDEFIKPFYEASVVISIFTRSECLPEPPVPDLSAIVPDTDISHIPYLFLFWAVQVSMALVLRSSSWNRVYYYFVLLPPWIQ